MACTNEHWSHTHTMNPLVKTLVGTLAATPSSTTEKKKQKKSACSCVLYVTVHNYIATK